MSVRFRIFAATPAGPTPLAPAPGVTELNDAFDALPLGIYEGMRTVDRVRLVGLAEHLERAERSIARLGWSVELDRTTLCACLDAVLADVSHGDSRVRFDVLARAIDTPLGETRLVFGLAPLDLPRPSAYIAGVGVRTLRELTREDPLIKRASFVVARRDFPLDGGEAFERLLVDDSERVLECTSSSFFGVRAKTVTTAGAGVLEGVTAGVVQRLVQEEGLRLDTRGLTTSDLAALDEAFLTSSVKGVVPVARIDGRPVGAGTPGPVARRLMERYEAWMTGTARRASEASPRAQS